MMVGPQLEVVDDRHVISQLDFYEGGQEYASVDRGTVNGPSELAVSMI
jgi:hypothetical protein